ncbi:hypothetical protein D3H35_05835 [Cohnella faecalis]|uniref:Uncharacterized protein n=2 Tax=Cohnella faecalis TaxID=2315694 RepID=A0A398CPQ5_9BACL|nr:hypothetical protein D3H35_05835 [Cohnella faecalis]
MLAGIRRAGVAGMFVVWNVNPYTSVLSSLEIPFFVHITIDCAVIFAVLAITVWLWFLSAVVPTVARRTGGNPIRMVVLAASETRKNVRLWSMLPLTACIHLISWAVAASCGGAAQAIAGLANGWVELLLLAGLLRVSKFAPLAAPRQAADSTVTVVRGRRTALIAIAALNLLLFGSTAFCSYREDIPLGKSVDVSAQYSQRSGNRSDFLAAWTV